VPFTVHVVLLHLLHLLEYGYKDRRWPGIDPLPFSLFGISGPSLIGCNAEIGSGDLMQLLLTGDEIWNSVLYCTVPYSTSNYWYQ
jgi:hypothetical protein